MTEPIGNELLQTLIAAIDEEVAAARAFRSSYTLGRGVRVPTASDRPLYSFSLANPPKLQEEARGRLVVEGAEVECTVISRRSDGLDVATFVDLGEVVEAATLTVDRSEVLSILGARMESVCSNTPPFPFNKHLAGEVLEISSGENDGVNNFVATPDGLTDDQKEAVKRALQNRATFIWGPPGTGKTTTLAALAWQLFRDNKRVLLVSHTNRAVDGVVEELCRRVVGKSRGNLPEGGIIRIGSLSSKTLHADFGRQIGLEAVGEAYRRKASERIEAVKKERDVNAAELGGVQQRLGLMARQRVLESELKGLQGMFAEAKSSESSLATVLRVLRIRYGGSDGAKGSVEDIKSSIGVVSSELFEVASQLNGVSCEELEDQVVELEARGDDLSEAIRDLEELTLDAERSTLSRARVVACTATQALLRCHTLGQFDAVIVDEASMLPLPLVVFLAGMAHDKVVIGGDFRQLPPISLSTSRVAREWFARDIFEVAGVVDLIDRGGESPNLAVLTTQFRGHEALCNVINGRFYGGRLVPKGQDLKLEGDGQIPAWLAKGSVLLVDSSSLSPFGYTENLSKGNLAHGLVVRALCVQLHEAGMADSPGDVGVISPYRPQVSLIEDLLDEANLTTISVGTAHRFQGAERKTIIVDLTESSPHKLGSFLGASSLRDPGAKLLNVSLSRAQQRVIVVADLSYLAKNLTEEHVLYHVVEDLKRLGQTVAIEELFSNPNQALAIPTTYKRWAREPFLLQLSADLQEARESVMFYAPAVSVKGARFFGAVFKPLVDRGIRCEVSLGYPEGGVDPLASEGAQILTSNGVAVSVGWQFCGSALVIDRSIVWSGGISPFDCFEVDEILMARVGSVVAAEVLARLSPVRSEAAALVGNG